jgi:acyl-CoA thioesterase I
MGTSGLKWARADINFQESRMESQSVVDQKTMSRRRWMLLTATFSALVLWRQLPAAQQNGPVRIMPLGDSVTSGLDGSASYRYWLWKQLQAKGFNVDFVGTLWGVGADGASGIYPDFDQDHEGHFGATTDDILNGIGDWAAQTQPQVVLLLIGGNDFQNGAAPQQVLDNTGAIINTLRSVNPNVAVLWAMLPQAPDQRAPDQAYNRGVSRLARAWSTPHSPIRAVDLWSGFSPAKDTLDGQHPNALGERMLAARFYAALGPILRRLGG